MCKASFLPCVHCPPVPMRSPRLPTARPSIVTGDMTCWTWHPKMARRAAHAQQRWSALLTAHGSRLAREMREALGERCWRRFVAYAGQYQRAFVAAFRPAGRAAAVRGRVRRRALPARVCGRSQLPSRGR